MAWEIIHRHLLHPSDSVVKSTLRHQTLDDIPKYFPNKIHKSPCKIYYTAKMTTIDKGTTVDTSNLQPGETIHMYFSFYNITPIRGFTSILILVYENTRILWIFPTVSKRTPIRIIHLILTTLINEQHSCKRVRFDEDIALANWTDVTNLLVDEFKISMETTGSDASWINGNN